MGKTKTNEDLQRERDRCTFDVKELTEFFDGGIDKTEERKYREKVLLAYKDEENNETPEYYLNHKQRYEQSMKYSVRIFDSVRKLQEEGKMVLTNYRELLGGLLGATSTRDGSALGLHYIMFMPCILSQGDDEQREYWLGRAWNSSIIGSYAQTELGHGTFIRGLETTATYDPETKEFVLNSPTLSSFKWWPGGLGQSANYCIVIAQLYTKGVCHGIHAFMVQVRDEETHFPLPGIKVGEIGPKMGFNAVNNGFLGFDKVRIPRNYMLMKHAQVSEDGTYVKSSDSKLRYSAMVFVRVVIVFDTVNYLSKAITIAIRYSAVRRQSQLKENEPEVQIMDYVTQQHKLFIGIAACFAHKLNGIHLWETFNLINEQVGEGNYERLAELHALACCLKAISTSDTAKFVEYARLSCGGHGYMLSSNLPLTYAQVSGACIYEGHNTVLLLQTARFLAKTWQNINNTKLTPTVAYLKTALEDSAPWTNNVDGIIRGFQIVATRKIADCVETMQKRVEAGKSFGDAWNLTSIRLVDAAEMHCRVIIISTFHKAMLSTTTKLSHQLRVVLNQLVELYAVYWALEKLNDLLRYTTISKRDVDLLQEWYENLLLKIRPNAVGLVDSFDIDDGILNSTLGAYDGRVYERLMEDAMKSPLNKEPVNESYHKYLKPFMQGKL